MSILQPVITHKRTSPMDLSLSIVDFYITIALLMNTNGVFSKNLTRFYN